MRNGAVSLGPVMLAVLALLALGGGAKGNGAKVKPSGKKRLTKAELVDLAKLAGFPDPNLAAAVALAESGGDPEAVGVGPKERSIGLWQINILAWKGLGEAELKLPHANAVAALGILAKAGGKWTPWGAYTNGSYKKYL